MGAQMGQLQSQIRSGFEDLRKEVTKDVKTMQSTIVTTVSQEPVHPQQTHMINTLDHQQQQTKNDGLMDVDMMDIADLEKERGDPGDVDMREIGAGGGQREA